ncbi:hypothetical protein [Chroococcidiopsis sp. CCMEE 29]|uniref:hypothetical protein n=1 Tax=Chroococcidiopsis sp. CCMEE 29 TaxID=155894 RepID=UPI0020203D69|nr:hypothetical protein [Chroococcidiopsis sp. CCMEE 29]
MKLALTSSQWQQPFNSIAITPALEVKPIMNVKSLGFHPALCQSRSHKSDST